MATLCAYRYIYRAYDVYIPQPILDYPGMLVIPGFCLEFVGSMHTLVELGREHVPTLANT